MKINDLLRRGVCEDLRREARQLSDRVLMLEAENRELRARLREKSRDFVLLREAFENALLMILLSQAGLPITQRFMLNGMGVTRRKWQRARALLQSGRLMRNSESLIKADHDRMVARVGKAFDLALEQPERVKARLPRSAGM